MAPGLELSAITKRYKDTTALDEVGFTIEDGELMTFLGPSGCGKTTMLRIIAGFLEPTAGRVVLKGRDITRVSPNKRPVNMVFQRSMLFPHLDVFGNVAFGLKLDKLPKAELSRRVGEALELVRLSGFERRRADQLSGGQMQRVALARALCKRPEVLLLDEPLSALDLKVRLEMEVELRRMHRETGAMFVYVTHDQREALALSDRVVVFEQGRVAEIAAPTELYRNPTSVFAARFVGDANVLPVDVRERVNGTATIAVGGRTLDVPCANADVTTGDAWLVLRPEVVRLGAASDADTRAELQGTVRDVAFRGTGFSYRLQLDGVAEELKAEVPAGPDGPAAIGDAVAVNWRCADCRLLPRA